MAHPSEQEDAVRVVRAQRLSTGGAGVGAIGPTAAEDVCVIAEAPVTLDLEGVERYTLLCTPTDARALAVGFLFSEGVIDGMDDVALVRPCDDDPLTIRIRLTHELPHLGERGRNLLIVSSCGACGSEGLARQLAGLPKAGDTLRIEATLLRAVYGELGTRQRLFTKCGAAHGAAVFDEEGRILSFAEDVGRHNALDKAIGICLMAGTSTAGCGVALTSRLSLEMVVKCARAGTELVAAVSAPTTLAIDVADQCNITLCAFVRESRATVFTHPHRLEGAQGEH
jgi:FdhD protein